MAFSVIYDWRLHGDVLPMSARMPAFAAAANAQTSGRPDVQAPRKNVVCPADDQAPARTASAATAASAARPATAGTVGP
jgi:soluble lytic murein transglycosylase